MIYAYDWYVKVLTLRYAGIMLAELTNREVGKMSRVIYSMYSRPEGASQYVLEPVGEAEFHQFGVNYEEFESGAGNYSTAILELDDGQVITVPADHIKFIKEPHMPAFGDISAALDKLTIR